MAIREPTASLEDIKGVFFFSENGLAEVGVKCGWKPNEMSDNAESSRESQQHLYHQPHLCCFSLHFKHRWVDSRLTFLPLHPHFRSHMFMNW